MAGLLGHTYKAIRTVESSMGQLRRAGLGPGTEVYEILAKTRADIWKSVGMKQPTVLNLIKALAGLSPGSIKVWHHAESGWMSEAKVSPGSPPVYKSISAETAIKIITGELTHELEAELMTPDEYAGE